MGKFKLVLTWWNKQGRLRNYSSKMENLTYSINIKDTVTHLVPLHSVQRSTSNETNVSVQSLVLDDLDYLNMLIILEVLVTALPNS